MLIPADVHPLREMKGFPFHGQLTVLDLTHTILSLSALASTVKLTWTRMCSRRPFAALASYTVTDVSNPFPLLKAQQQLASWPLSYRRLPFCLSVLGVCHRLFYRPSGKCRTQNLG